MRSSRLLALLLLLQARGRMSASEIAEEFEISIRTVYRDIDALSAAGVPVYGESGPGGGFQFHDGYRAGLTGLTLDEASALLLAGFPQAIEVFGLDTQADLAHRKVAASLKGLSGTGLSNRIHLDPDPWYRRRPVPQHLASVARAVVDGAQIQMEYRSWRKISRPVVEPLGLVLKAGSWYLVAQAKGRVTTFGISSVAWVRRTGKTAAVPDRFSLADYWTDRCDAFEMQLHKMRATLRVKTDALHRLDRLGSAIAQAFQRPSDDEGEWRTAEIPIESVEHAARELLSLGDSFEVIQPESLREEVAHLSRVALQRHASAESG